MRKKKKETIEVTDFDFGYLSFEFLSDFGFRISDFLGRETVEGTPGPAV
jgi:hypothetical protein